MEPKDIILFKMGKDGEKLMKPVLLGALKRFQDKFGGKHGAFYMEWIAEAYEELQELDQHVMSIVTLVVIPLIAERNEVYVSSEGNKFSLIKLPGYRLWYEMINEVMPGLQWNLITKQFDQGSAPTLNYETLKKIFLNKDPSDLVAEREDYEKKVSAYRELFLDYDGSNEVPRVFLASFNRCGNTMFRKLFEQSSGVVTGADMLASLPPMLQFMWKGFKGEWVVNSRTWISKTHFPYTNHVSRPQSGSCAVVLVRNPIDSFISYLNLYLSSANDTSFENELHKEFPEAWSQWVSFNVEYWIKYYQYYIDLANSKQLPLYFIRYEDAVPDKKRYLAEAYSFILGVENLSGTYLEQRINALPSEAGKLYNLKTSGTQQNLEKYTEAQLALIKTECREILNFFGYSSFEDQDNFYGIFKYEEPTEEEKHLQNKYLEVNKEMKEWYHSNKAELDLKKFEVNRPEDCLNIDYSKDGSATFRANLHKFRFKQ